MEKFDVNTVEYSDVLMFYHEEMTPYKYIYHLESEAIVELIFNDGHFCKLLALDEFAPSPYNRREYLDIAGINLITSGTITSEKMKKEKYGIWHTYRNRIEYFPYLVVLLNNPEYVIFDYSKANCKIKAAIILVYKLSDNELLHLFCNFTDKEKTKIKPVTFIVHKNEKYVLDQENCKVVKTERVEIS